MVRHGDFADDGLEVEDIGLLSTGCGLMRAARGGAEDFLLLVRERIVHPDIKHEAVKLGLGERISAFLLDGVLRSEDEEWFLQLIRVINDLTHLIGVLRLRHEDGIHD